MNAKKQWFWSVLCGLVLVVMSLPLVRSFAPGKHLRPLVNVQVHQDDVQSAFQRDVEDYCKREVGFADNWVRLINELNYRLFHYSKTEKLVLGNDDYFYEEMYITEYLGRNFTGDEYISMKAQLISDLQDSLRSRYGISLIPVFTPGKAAFSPEKIPEQYHPQIQNTNNYSRFIHFFYQKNITYLDLYQYFKDKKKEDTPPLYSKYGVHWSSYGLWLAADSLAHFIEHSCGLKLPEIVETDHYYSNKSKDLDFDLEPPMNLLCELPHETLYFPVVQIIEEANSTKPKVLTIADSYYWGFMDQHIAERLFSSNVFWYYNNKVWPDLWNEKGNIDDSKRREVILAQDVILLMITDANLYDYGWNFAEQTMQELFPSYQFNQKLKKYNIILHDKEMYYALLRQSALERCSFEEVLKAAVL